jgi:hypothetical protein
LKASLWIRAGIAAAGAAILGPVMIGTGEASLLGGAVAFIGGAALSMFAWRRTMRLLGDDSPALPVVRRRSPKPGVRAAAVQAR